MISQPSKMSCSTNTKLKNKLNTDEKQEKRKSVLIWRPSHPLLPVEKAQRMCNWHSEMKLSWGGRGWCTLHSLPTPPPHAWWHPSHGFPDRQVDSRWFSMIGVTRLTAHHKNSSLLQLRGKTLICVFRLPKCHQRGGACLSLNFWNKISRYLIFFQPSLQSKVEFGEQTVKNVDNLLGSGVTHV